VDLRSPSITRDHEEREAPLLHHINPVSPIPLPDQLVTVTGAVLADVAIGGIGARSGVDAVRAR
jgi:hypothetical protein